MEFKATDLTDQVPKEAICSECAKCGAEHLPTEAVLVYCPHNLSGAWSLPGKSWTVLRGIEKSYFQASVLRGLTMGELVRDVEKGLQNIIQLQGADSVKH